MKGFIDLIAKHAFSGLGIISSTCCFHDKFGSIIIPRNFYILSLCNLFIFIRDLKVIILVNFRMKLKKMGLINI